MCRSLVTGHSKRHLQDRVPEAENRGSLVHVPASGLRAPCALSPECPRLGSVCPLPCVPTSGLPLPSPLYVCVWAPCALFPVCPRLGSLYPLPCVPASGLRVPSSLCAHVRLLVPSPECPRLGSLCPLPCVPTSGLPVPSPLCACVWAPCALSAVCLRLGSMCSLPCVPASGLRVPSPLCARVRLLVPSPLCAHVWAPGSGCPLICLLWDHTAQKPGHTSSLQKLQGESQAGLLLGHVLIPAA